MNTRLIGALSAAPVLAVFILLLCPSSVEAVYPGPSSTGAVTIGSSSMSQLSLGGITKGRNTVSNNALILAEMRVVALIMGGMK